MTDKNGGTSITGTLHYTEREVQHDRRTLWSDGSRAVIFNGVRGRRYGGIALCPTIGDANSSPTRRFRRRCP